MSDDHDSQPDYQEARRADPVRESRRPQVNRMPPGLEAKGDRVIDPELQAIIRTFKERYAR